MTVDIDHVHQAGLELEADLTTPDVALIHQEVARRHRMRQGVVGLGVAGLVLLAGFGLNSVLNEPSTTPLNTASADETDGEVGTSTIVPPSTTVPSPPEEETLLRLTPVGTFTPDGLFTVQSTEPDEVIGAYVTLEIWTAEGTWVDVVGLLIAAEHGGGEPRIAPLGSPLGGESAGFDLATFRLPPDLELGNYRVCESPGSDCGTFELA